jgi:hypothetical protein
MRPVVAITPATTRDEVEKHALDRAFLAWFEARLSRADSSEDDVLSYLVGLALCEP